MAKVKLQLPDHFPFTTQIPVRITDINYGNHLANDAVLSLLHEARMQFLNATGFTELDFGGVGIIMADAVLEFKSEAFYGDVLTASVAAGEFSKIGFDLYYKLEKSGTKSVVVLAKTGMVCFDYSRRKITALPPGAMARLQQP